jgi:hypothetical protein
LKKYNTRFIFYTTKSLKKEMRKRAKELDIPMSDYLRTLIKQDIKLNEIASNNLEQGKNLYDIENFNKKLSGYYKGL